MAAQSGRGKIALGPVRHFAACPSRVNRVPVGARDRSRRIRHALKAPSPVFPETWLDHACMSLRRASNRSLRR